MSKTLQIATYERTPVVVAIPYDRQKLDSTSNQPYETSAVYYPKVGRIHPDPAIVAEVVDRLIAAKRPIIIGGRGVLYAGAKAAVVKLADRCGALLANTLPTRGLFHDHEFYVGIPGSYFTTLGREVFETAEVVLAIGTSLSYYVGRSLLHPGLPDPGGRCPARPARWAEGRRYLCKGGCAGRRGGDLRGHRQEARARQADGGRDPLQGASAQDSD